MSSLYPKQMFSLAPMYITAPKSRQLTTIISMVAPVNRQTPQIDGVINNTENPPLPHELVIEILSWLPVKYLFQFRCVSKTWLRLLTLNPKFAKLHYTRSIQFNKLNVNPSIIAWTRDRKDLFLAFDYTACDKAIHLDLRFHEEGDNRYRISGFCNGLLCLHRKDGKQVYVWNPLTKDCITISCSPTPFIRFPRYFNQTVFGFGFDESSNEYKVIRAFCEFDLEEGIFHSQVSVYTLGVDSSWRTVDEDSQYYVSSVGNKIILVNGVLHWISMKPGTSSFDLILGFDLKDEVFQEIPLPSAIMFDDDSYSLEIAELGGYLCMFTRNDEIELEIWLMIEYGVFDSWTKVLIIEKPEVRSFHFEPVGITLNGDFILKLNRHDLLLYDPKTKTFAKLKEFRFTTYLTYAYMGSLISPSFISRVGHNLMEDET